MNDYQTISNSPPGGENIPEDEVVCEDCGWKRCECYHEDAWDEAAMEEMRDED